MADQTVVITDTSCLIILEKIGLLYVLHQLFTYVITTPEIEKEYGEPLPEWIVIIPVNDLLLKDKFSLLVDSGEASAIALAHEIKYNHLITDDMEARKLAIKLGMAVMGSLGVLTRAKEAGYITHIKPFIELMKQNNFRVAEELYQSVLKKAGEN